MGLKSFSREGKQDILFVLGSIILFIIVRSINYAGTFNFIYDQVSSSITVMELWRNKDISLIGPQLSLMIENRQLFFGGVSYFIQMLFLLIGRFDPFWSTYAFMVASAAMIAPLYYGTKRLINTNAAIFMTLIYTLLPFFIQGTSFFWNPYFQLALIPGFIYLMAMFKKKKSTWRAIVMGIYVGVLFQLHYLFIAAVFGLLIYYFGVLKIRLKYLVLFGVGFSIGIGNLILFEVRNDFYLFRTLHLFLTTPGGLGVHSGHWFADYYFLGPIFFGLLLMAYVIRNQLNKRSLTMIFVLLILYAYQFVVVAAADRHEPPNWYYEDDLKVYSIIREKFDSGEITNFNVFEFYSPVAATQKYFMKRDGIKINYNEYFKNKYLYVVYKDDSYMNDAAYEVEFFLPNRLVEEWQINDHYNLYLLERLEE